MRLQFVPPLLGHDVEQMQACLTAGRNGTQHAHHLFHMTFAGIGDQKIAEHGLIRGSFAAYG
jgi:hypothetical protein